MNLNTKMHPYLIIAHTYSFINGQMVNESINNKLLVDIIIIFIKTFIHKKRQDKSPLRTRYKSSTT